MALFSVIKCAAAWTTNKGLKSNGKITEGKQINKYSELIICKFLKWLE